MWGGEEELKEAHRKKGEMQEKKREKKYAGQIKGQDTTHELESTHYSTKIGNNPAF